ncbi:cytochrome P450 [Apiospora marii]|uniref:Cytochrome P450 n=1 Tax=Apiospora marii TaxID=335849 RepID=A0ABR1R1Q6_9PEZI
MDLVALVQRKSPTMSFAPIMLQSAAGIMGFSKGGMEIASEGQLEGHGLLSESAKVNHASLCPGPGLAAMEPRFIQLLSESKDRLAVGITSGDASANLNLHEWVSRSVIEAAMVTVYGPENPFRDSETVEIWQQFWKGFVPLLFNIAPHITAAKSVQARQHLIRAFEQYYAKKGYAHPETSLLIKDRHALFSQRGMSKNDMARHEVGATLALLINTIPATFWFVYRLLSDPVVLEACRRELLQIASADGNGTRVVDMESVKNSCPVFNSTLKETLRFHSTNVAARAVVEDTLVDGRYLLKKGGLLLIPSTVQHQSAAAWGEDVSDFNHRRFVPGDPPPPTGNHHQRGKKKKKRIDPAALRVFGGGSVVCPGRYFAATEMMAVAALIVLRFDVRPRRGGGQWSMPTTHRSNPGISFKQPDHDIQVEVRARDKSRWAMTLLRQAGGDAAGNESPASAR